MSISVLPPDIAASFCEFGFHPGQHRLLLLVPAVQTAWAEGFVQATERRTLERLARQTFRATRSETDVLDQWLAERPSEDLIAGLNGLLREWLDGMEAAERDELKGSIIAVCLEVARSSPRIGFDRNSSSAVCRDEESELSSIRQRLGV